MATKNGNDELAPLASAPRGMTERENQPLGAWDEPGQRIVSKFFGFRESQKYPGRQIVDLIDDDGVVTSYACPVILEQLLRGVEKGTVVDIYYRGVEKDTKQFQVFTTRR